MKNTSWKTILILAAVVIIAGIALLVWWNRPADSQLSATFLDNAAQPEFDPNAYSRAAGIIPLPFPETYGPHPNYRTEWWYYTGNLETADGRHFGYQLTFFRQALLPEPDRPASDSDWRTNQLYFAHFTLTDAADNEFTFSERFSRGAAGLAGAQAEPYRVWLEDWEVQQIGADQYQLTAQQGDIHLELTMVDEKGPVLQGLDGYSQKGTDPANASYYYSQTRLRSSGTITIGENRYAVEGLSWKDHEFGTSALSEGQVGWDWFSIQLDNNTELMLYHIRQEDGSIDPYSSGTLVYPDGSTRHLTQADFSITVLDRWASPNSGGEYPAAWQVSIPEEEIDLTVRPYIADQELLVTVVYWEGAVRVEGTYGGQLVTGSGYVELTGYTQSMEGRL
jgi:predicted secreted hydrolase